MMELSQRIWHIGTAFLLLMLLLSGRLVYWQLVRGAELQPTIINPLGRAEAGDRGLKALDLETLTNLEDVPQPVIQRTADALRNITRGTIYDRNGRALALTVTDENGERSRFYTEPSLASTLGYVNALNVGVLGVEQAFNEQLFGLDRLDAQFSQAVHRPVVGSDVYLTIDSHLQRAAAEALGNRAGAIAILDAPTGAILALASNPTFDPNRILETAYFNSLINCQTADCTGALVNRASQGLYPPGSTWKTVTLMTALDTGQATPETVFDFGTPRQGPEGIYYVYEVDGAEIIDPNHDEPRLDLVRSYAVSANAAFAQLGDEMPPQVMLDYAGQLGFSPPAGPPPLETGMAAAQLANFPQSIFENNVLRAATAFGQGELLTTPLQMALTVAGVVNQGNIPTPHFLERVQAPDGDVLETGQATPWVTGVIRPETAQQTAEIMVNAVQNGSGVRARVPGIVIGGKTGTAEIGPDRVPHAWFIGFAHENERTVVMAIIVENGGEGADVAAPLFARLAPVALRELGRPVPEIIESPQ
jgi:peptidoglycan glycosyltransferase